MTVMVNLLNQNASLHVQLTILAMMMMTTSALHAKLIFAKKTIIANGYSVTPAKDGCVALVSLNMSTTGSSFTAKIATKLLELQHFINCSFQVSYVTLFAYWDLLLFVILQNYFCLLFSPSTFFHYLLAPNTWYLICHTYAS